MRHVVLSIGLVGVLSLGQIPPPPESITPTATWSWTAPTVNTDGSPLTDLGGYLFAVAPAAVDLTEPDAVPLEVLDVPLVDIPQYGSCAEDACTAVFEALLSAVPDGDYRGWSKAYDLAGNLSPWSVPTEPKTLDRSAPAAPIDIDITQINPPAGWEIFEVQWTARKK